MRNKAIFIFLLAVAVRLVFFAVFSYHAKDSNFYVYGGDTPAYLTLADNLSRGLGFTSSLAAPYVAEAGPGPVMPAILSLFGNNISTYIVFQILLSGLSAVFLYLIAINFLDEWVGLWAGVLLAIDPLSTFHSLAVMTETLFTFLFLCSVYYISRFWVRSNRFWEVEVSAIFLGLAALTRSVALVFVPLYYLFFWLSSNLPARKKITTTIVFTLVFTAVLAPWAIRNHNRLGVYGISYLPAYNWYMFNAREFYAAQNHLPKQEVKTLFHQKNDAEMQRLGAVSELQIQDFYISEAWKIIAANPFDYLKFHAINTAAVFLNAGEEDITKAWTGKSDNINYTAYLWKGPAGLTELAKEHPWAVLGKFLFGILYAVILLGLVLSFKAKKALVFGFLFLMTLTFGLTTGAAAEPRFHVPPQPFILLLFAQSVIWLSRFKTLKSQDQIV